MLAKRALIMHPSDNVATAVEDIRAGESVAVPVVQRHSPCKIPNRSPSASRLPFRTSPREGLSGITVRPSARPASPSQKGRLSWGFGKLWGSQRPQAGAGDSCAQSSCVIGQY